MKTIEWTQGRIDKLRPYQSTPTVGFGRPGRKHLSKWIYDLDLKKYSRE